MVISTVYSSTARDDSYGPSWKTAYSDLVSGLTMRSRLNTTASALNGVPSWNVTSSRSARVQVTLSSATLHSVANPGKRLPSGERSMRRSKRAWKKMESRVLEFTCGSRVLGSASTAIVNCAPSSWAAAKITCNGVATASAPAPIAAPLLRMLRRVSGLIVRRR
jgi:hypothetical protein